MGGGVAVKPFQFQRDIEHALDHGFFVGGLFQLRFGFDGLAQVDGIGGIERHELAELVDLSVRHFQHAPDIAHHAARLHGAERDDLRDLLAPVFFLNVANDFLAALLTEIDIEVRHRNTLRIQEALEQQAETQRIQIRDVERIGDQRARTRTAAGPDGNILLLCPADEVGHDQEIARIFHALDDIELESQPLFVICLRKIGREAVLGQAPQQAFLCLTA